MSTICLRPAPPKQKSVYTEINCKSALHKHQGGCLPFKYDLNAYRGCTNGCKYCYAMYSHQYIDAENYFDNIFVKTNIAEHLEKELSSPQWARQRINLGGITDSYQRAETYYKIMPDIWRLLIKYKTPAVISTKSDLILRDYDLIAELASLTHVNIAVTITTTDYGMQRLIEPGAADPDRRFIVLREFTKTKARTGLHMMPIIPRLTDLYDNLASLFDCAASCRVGYILPGMLFLRSRTRIAVFEFIAEKLPHLYQELYRLYGRDKSEKQAYEKQLKKVIATLIGKYRLSGG